MLEGQWKGVVWPASAEAAHDPVTGVDVDILKDIGRASVKVPEGFVRFFFNFVSEIGRD
jgi:probable 2-oxoglutarate dehydrogenase E1 component DHKTD1